MWKDAIWDCLLKHPIMLCLVKLIIQGERRLTVKSNLALTGKNNAINRKIFVISVQERLTICPWMIIMIICWPQRAQLLQSLFFKFPHQFSCYDFNHTSIKGCENKSQIQSLQSRNVSRTEFWSRSTNSYSKWDIFC